MIAVDYPLLINKNRIHRFVPSYTQTVSAPIIRKYPIRNNIQFLSTVIGSTIEISKFKDFTETDIVKHFKHTMTTNTLLIKFNKRINLRYLRYSAQKDKRIELGEFRFYKLWARNFSWYDMGKSPLEYNPSKKLKPHKWRWLELILYVRP